MAWISIDAGTSVIKAVLLESSGEPLALARATVPVLRSGQHHAEQDMEAVWHAVVTTVREVLLAYTGTVEGIVTTAQGDGVWLIGFDGAPVRHAILWNDGRAAAHSPADADDPLARHAFALSGSMPYPGLPSAILPWLREHEPGSLQRARWATTCNGWLHFKLTGKVVAEISDASNPFLDLRRRCYSQDLTALYDLADCTPLLPPLCICMGPRSTISRTAAEQLGLAHNLPVLMAPYDIVTAAAGCGSVLSGEGCLILGTTICAEVLTDDPGLDRAPAGTTLALPTGQYLRAMPTLTGCEAIEWAASLVKAESLEQFHQLAREVAPGAENLVFLPYLSPAGERAPFLDATAKGSFHGLALTHGREHIARAVLEGLSFAVRECLFAALGTRPLRLAVCGGGSRSDAWCQIIADVCGCEVSRTAVAEVGAQGALFYALVATGGFATLAEAAHASARETRRFVPNPACASIYDALYARFLRLRLVAAETWSIMREGVSPFREGQA